MPIANMTSDVVPYNLVNITSGGNILDFVRNVNNLVDGAFMFGMLIAGFIILLVSMMNRGGFDNKDALVASGFITTILAILFFMLEFITVPMLTIIIIAFGIIFVFTVLKKS